MEQLQQKLQDERDRIKAIVDSMGEGLLVVDTKYVITMANPVAERLLGLAASEILGFKWSEIVAAYEGVKEIPFDARTSIVVINTGSTIVTNLEANHYYQPKGGDKFPIVSVTAPIMSSKGITGAVKVFHDASEELGRKKGYLDKVAALELEVGELKKRLGES
jgi:PAS domain S-box-containing protein